jgi:uroporphyrinogen-III synthase
MQIMSFRGARVLSLESRRAAEMATLIRKQDGEPFVAPSMREVALEEHQEAFAFAEYLMSGGLDGVILLTGVGARLLWKTLVTRYAETDLLNALRSVTLIVRGPKPSATLREIGLTANVQVPEPNTWRELLATMQGRPETRLALQEYGKSNTELIEGLKAQGREVTPVRIYGWDLPEDMGLLREAARRVAAGEFPVALFTTSMQIVNLMRIATEQGIAHEVAAALNRAFIASIGPTTTETLEDYGLHASFEPSHPKMGILVNEASVRFESR